VLVALLLVLGISEGASDSSEVVQANEIRAKIERGEPVEYDGMIVVGDLDLNGTDLGSVHFNDTVFCGSVNFANTNFIGAAWFREAEFTDGVANFKKAEFTGEAVFEETEFTGEAIFEGAKFIGGDADFSRAEFIGGDADFSRAKFIGGGASFRKAEFIGGDADFSRAEFIGGGADFEGAKFIGGGAKFVGAKFIGGGASFREAEFIGGDADFDGAKFSGKGGDFKDAVFSGGVANFKNAEFSNGYAIFEKTKFSGGDAIFEKTKFSGGDANFKGTKFSGGDANFKGAKFSGGDANFEKAEFSKYALFEGAEFGKEYNKSYYARLDAYRIGGGSTDGQICLNRTQYDKICIKWDSIKDGKLKFDNEAYLKLIMNYKELGWFEDYNECYYYYMKERECDGCFRWFVKQIFFVSYGYGAKPQYPLIWSAATIFLFGIIWWRMEPSLKNGKNVATWKEALKFSFMVFLSSTKISVDPPDLEARGESWDKSLFLTERVIASLLFYFFLFAASTSLLIKIV